mgnify:CR=1 FL=1
MIHDCNSLAKYVIRANGLPGFAIFVHHVSIPGRAIGPDLPNIYNIALLGVTVDINKFAAGFGADYGDMALELCNELIKFAGLYINFHK